MINEKTLWSKDFARNLGYENNHYKDYMKIINSCKFCCKCTFLPFLFFHGNQKQESNFQQVGGLVTRNSFTFCLQRVLLYFKGMPNSIHFYKRIFLHVIPVRITVPCFHYQDHLDFAKHLINIYLLKKVYVNS